MGELYLHIGTIKTGTKFLQKEVFPKLKNMVYMKKPFLSFALTCTYFYPKVLISDERLSGWGETNLPVSWRLDTFKRVKQLFPNAKIIITLRTDEEEFRQSNYAQMCAESPLSMNFFRGTYETFLKNYDSNWNNHEMIIKELTSVFGVDSVLILYYSELVQDADRYVKKICDFMGVEVPKFVNRKYNVRHRVGHPNPQKRK